MRRFLSVILTAQLVTFGFACSRDTEQSGESDSGDTAADVGVDAPSFDTSDNPGGDAGDGSDRTPIDADPSWDFGLPDEDGTDGAFAIERVVPPSGPLEGGNRVRIVGTGLDDDVRVYFGGRELDVEFSGGALVGDAPPGSAPGPVSVKAIDASGETRGLQGGYEYVAGVDVDRIAPSRIPTDGGVEVTIEGEGFGDPTAVSFSGDSALRVNRIDRTLLRAVAPPGEVGAADVRITTQAESHVVEEGVEYVEPLEIESVRPAAGPTAGGESVTVEVSGLRADASVEFGGSEATVLRQDLQNGEIEVETPAHAAGLVDVSVQSDGDAAIARDHYLYRDSDSPTVAAIDPDVGPTSGGTEASLIGEGLDASNLEVTFGGAPATLVETKPTFVRLKTPSGDPGAVDVVATAGASELGRIDDGFEYRETIWLDDVSPDRGPASGGTKVVLKGSGFQSAERVSFGHLPAEFSISSNERIEATAPPHSAGSVDVRVEGSELGARLRDGFEYTTDLEVWGFRPARGAVAGGTYVTVRGKGFGGRLGVSLGETSAPEVRRIDRNNLYLYTPPHEPGEVDLEVEGESGSAVGPYPYEYFNPASRYGGAGGGAIEGAVNVTVLSQGGGPIPGAFVMLSTRADTPYTGTTDSNGQLTLSGPDVFGPQTVTATAKDFSTTTVHSVDAENLTVFLRNMEPSDGGGGGGGGGPPTATIEGTVSAPVKMANPDEQKTYDMAVVQTTKKEISARQRDPGPGSVVFGDGHFEIHSRIGDLAVVATCGVYDERTEEFEPNYIGVERYLSMSDGETQQVDLTCDVPLDRTLEVKLENPVFAPSGPDTNLAEVYWDFGFDGVLRAPTTDRGLSKLMVVENQPTLEGALSDVTFSVIAGSFTGNSSPSTQTQKHDIDDLSNPVAMPPLVDVPEPVDPKPGGPLEGRELRFQAEGPYYPDLYSVYLLNQEGRPFWHYLMSGQETVVRLPDFPDFSFLPAERRPEPMSSGEAFFMILGIDARNATFDSFTYRDLSYSRWRGYSVTRWGFRIP